MDLETSTAIESLRHDLRAEILRSAGGRTSRAADSHDRKTRFAPRCGICVKSSCVKMNAAVLTESVRDDIRIVAEGLAAVSAKIDGLRRRIVVVHPRNHDYRRAAGHSRAIGGSSRRVPRTIVLTC